MKVIDLTQRSPEWHEWRAGLGMASEAAVVMDAAPSWAPVRTWAELRAAKVGLEAEVDDYLDRLREHGEAQEEMARGVVCPTHLPLCVEHPKGLLGASLDGYDKATRSWVEIKCPTSGTSSSHWKVASENASAADPRDRVQPYVWWQLVHQAHVVGKKAADFAILLIWLGEDYGSTEGDGYLVIEIPIARLMEDWPALEERWKLFLAGEEQGRTDNAWTMAALQWLEADGELKTAKAKQDDARKVLVELSGDGQGSKGAGVKVTESSRQGNVDWPKYAAAKLFEGDVKAATADAEDYRKPASTFHRISPL